MDSNFPETALELGIIRQHEHLVRPNLIRLVSVVVLVDGGFRVYSNVEVRVRFTVQGPRVHLDHGRFVDSEVEVAELVPLAPEEDWLHVLQLERLSHVDAVWNDGFILGGMDADSFGFSLSPSG